MRRSLIPNNYAPAYGATKTVLLTLAERKAIGRHKLAQYVTNNLSDIGSSSIIRSRGNFYRFSCIVADSMKIFQVRRSGDRGTPAKIINFSSSEEFVDYLRRFNECELRRIEKMRIQREADHKSIEGTRAAKASFSGWSLPILL